MPGKIEKLSGRTILDSRGSPTIEAVLVVDSKAFKASVPSGASTGAYEAVELRDQDGSVSGAIENINKIISPKLIGKDVCLQKDIDDLMIGLDGTKNKARLGGNAICAVSLVVCRAGAEISGMNLFRYVRSMVNKEHNLSIKDYNIPSPSFNIINGGCHAQNDLDVQEFMVVPYAKSFSEKMKKIQIIYDRLRNVLIQKFGKDNLSLGDEGGFAPMLSNTEEALELILEVAEGEKIGLILDVAASQFFREEGYGIDGNNLNRKELVGYYENLASKYPIIGIEDPFSEDDWKGFSLITSSLGDKISIIGDDLLVTSPKRIKKAQQEKAVNTALLKINQVGTVSEALEYAKLARDFGWKIMVSHRSGETLDDFIADFSVGIGADFIKSGAPSQKERMVKYNRLLEIEKEII